LHLSEINEKHKVEKEIKYKTLRMIFLNLHSKKIYFVDIGDAKRNNST